MAFLQSENGQSKDLRPTIITSQLLLSTLTTSDLLIFEEKSINGLYDDNTTAAVLDGGDGRRAIISNHRRVNIGFSSQ